MAASTGEGDEGRERLLARLRAAGREHSTAAVLFHAAVAEKLGLGATDTKTLDLLERQGPMSPGRLARLTGLAPASVTGVLDRLQRRGFIRRLRDPEDGRRQLVEIDRARIPPVEELFTDLLAGLDRLYAGYTTEQLALILDWLTRTTEIQRAAAQRLSGTPRGGLNPRRTGGGRGPRSGWAP
ncbi:MAG TPA: MarR family transcriptional regulator [Geodermatophilus sp.]|nr:MarR family transcriptional regulator [Geodermatophilus sp.]